MLNLLLVFFYLYIPQLSKLSIMGADRIKAECKKITYVTSRILKLQKYFTSNLKYKTEPTRIVCLAVSLPGSAVS
jgi:hypothetical protein